MSCCIPNVQSSRVKLLKSSILQPPPADSWHATHMLVPSCRVSAGGGLPDVLKESDFIKSCQVQVSGRYQEQVVRAVIGHNLLLKGVLYWRMQLLLSRPLIFNATVVHDVFQEPIGFGTQEGHKLPHVCASSKMCRQHSRKLPSYL